MAIEIPDWSSKSSDQLSKEAEGVFEQPQIENLDPTLLELYNKMRESLSKINEHITKVASMQSEINTEKSKTGITSTQASNITTNNGKTGITTAQASAITANTAKTGISTSQAKQLQALASSTIPIGNSNLTMTLATSKTSTLLVFRVITGKVVKTGSITLS